MEKTQKTGTQANQSAEKMLVMLEYLAGQSEPIRLLDISKDLGVNVSTALRFLTALINKGYVTQEEGTSRYYMTYKICALANRVSVHMDIRSIVKPYMEQLSQLFGESVCLAIEESRKVVYIEVVEGSGQMLRTMQRIGNVAPMHCTGIGKLLLLNYSDAELDQLIETEGLERYTEYTLVSKSQLTEELSKIRRQGVAYDNEECELGARCVAGPIYDSSGRVVAGVSVTGPTNHLADEFIAERLGEFRRIMEEISFKMGYKAFEP